MPSLRFLVTGGSQGIGAAIVEAARAAGHQVVFTGRNESRIDDVARRTGAQASRGCLRPGRQRAHGRSACDERMGGVDVLVNNAGYAYRAEIGALDVERCGRCSTTNVFGLVDITNRVVPLMKAQGHGDIVNIASTSGMKGGAADALRREQVGGSRHQSVLAGGVAAARHPRRLRVPVGGADQFRRQDRPQQSRTSCTRTTSPRRSWRRSTCRGGCCGPSWRCSRTTRGRKTERPPPRSGSREPAAAVDPAIRTMTVNDRGSDEPSDVNCCRKGIYASGSGSASSPAWRTLPTTPTIVRHSSGAPMLIRDPIGSAPFQYRRAAVSLMTTTSGLPSTS